jgi:hypothetical protein
LQDLIASLGLILTRFVKRQECTRSEKIATSFCPKISKKDIRIILKRMRANTSSTNKKINVSRFYLIFFLIVSHVY